MHFPAAWGHLAAGGIRYYSLLYVGVFLGGYQLFDWQLRRAGADREDAADFVLYGVVAVLVGARLGHALFYEWDRFVADPLWLLEIHKGGLASHGAALALLLAMYGYTRRRRQSFVEGCDRFAFSAALGAILVRIGNLFNSEIVGVETDADWGVRFPRYDGYAPAPLRHPTQIYEALLGVGVLAALFWADRHLGREGRPRGALISLFCASYFTGRFIVEFWKLAPPQEMAGGLTTGQWLSLAPAVIGYAGWYASRSKRIPAGWSSAGTAPTPSRKNHDI